MLTVKYFHFILYLFLWNDEYADLKLNFFVPKRTMEPSSWQCLAFTDGPSDGMSHCTVNGQCVKYDLITSHTAEEDHLDWGLLWLCWWSPGIVQNFDLISLLWITFPSPWSSKDVISSKRKGWGSKGKPKRSMPLDRSAWQAVINIKHPPVSFFLVLV